MRTAHPVACGYNVTVVVWVVGSLEESDESDEKDVVIGAKVEEGLVRVFWRRPWRKRTRPALRRDVSFIGTKVAGQQDESKFCRNGKRRQDQHGFEGGV